MLAEAEVQRIKKVSGRGYIWNSKIHICKHFEIAMLV